MIEVSTTEVTTLLEELDGSKAPGPDNIPTVVLKRCASALAPSITALFNCSFANGHFVSAWKTANICPVHKRENNADVTNYRPISLLPILSKIQEKCVLKRLLPHICEALFPMQHGFIKGLSCTTQLLQVFHEIGNNLDKGLETDIINLDFSKAFDSVCHQKLLSKLLYFGIDGPLLKWFESYLSARKQRVVINGSYSSWSEVRSGVIQGSILGPVIFLMFVNDMPEVLRSSYLAMFADDSKRSDLLVIAMLYKLICQHLTLGLSKTKSSFSHPSATIYESVERKQVLLDCTLLMAPQLKWLPKKKILVL